MHFHSPSLSRFLLRLHWLWWRVPRMPRRKGVLVAVYFFWCERFTPSGKMAAGLWLFALFLESLPGLSGVWPVLVLLTGAFVAAWLGSWRSPPGTVELETPPRVRSGEALLLRAAPMGVASYSHAGIFHLHDFLTTQESSAEDPWRIPAQAREPGRYVLRWVTLLRTEPLGLMRARRRIPQDKELVVHPRPVPIASFEFLTQGMSGRDFARLLTNSISRGGDFVGVRPYREGDSQRDLHYQAFARYGVPFSREYAPEEGGGVVLALETVLDRRTDALYLAIAVRLCAGLALWLDERGLLAGFALNGEVMHPPRERVAAWVLDQLAAPARASGSVRLPVCAEPVLVVGCSAKQFGASRARTAPERAVKRVGVGELAAVAGPLPDSLLWLDWFLVHRQMQGGRGLPL
jgi:hypothetical protein